MRTHTSEFKNRIKRYGRVIQGKIIYYPSYDLVSENNDNILTEANLQIISEQANYDDPIEIDEENIFSISIIKNGDLLQSLMKEFDFEAKEEFNIGSVVNPQFGLLIDDETQTYEYLDYGNYIVNSKEFNMDTQTWSYVCFDKMIFAMVKYRPLTNVTYPITIKQYINLMCRKIGLEFEDSEFVNQDQLIYEDLYKDKGLTYRDIFDEISKIVAGNLLINDDDKLQVGYLNKSIEIKEINTNQDITIHAKEGSIDNLTLGGNITQATTPSVDYPIDVEVVTGNINIKISNQNETKEQDYLLSLGNIELCKIENYQDYIYFENNNWYIHKEIDKIILDGSENWGFSTITSNVKTQRFRYNATTAHDVDIGYCNRFKVKDVETSVYDDTELVQLSPSNSNKYIGIQINKDRLLSNTVEDFKIWLSSNNVILYYLLLTPTTIQITNSTLIEQLDNLKNATLYDEINNITINGADLTPYIKFNYVSGYETINEDYLKDTNVKMGEKFGVINSVAVLDTDNDLQYIAQDTQSIKENEMTRITITDNLIALNGDTQTIADNVLNQLNGLYYYINDFVTTGVCYFDYLDMFDVEARGNVYQCLLLNNEITISQGIEEHIFTEKLEESQTSANEYTTSVITNKQVQFKINQQEGKLESKVEKDGVISAINQSAEEIQINASKLSFAGATIDMTADNIKIQGENLDIDSNGVITLTDNSAASSLSSETLHSAYIIESIDTVNRAGTIETLNFRNEIVANGKRLQVEDNWEYQGTTGGGINGIKETVYSQPRITLYSQSNDYDPGSLGGSYQDLDISLNGGISYNEINNGVLNTPLIITSGGRITCVSVTQTSKEENKKNFERLTNAKEILNLTDIYKYNMIDEKDDTKKHIGFIIGDSYNYSQDITSVENNGVDIYSMVSVLWQVVKEQQEEIQELKEMINNGKY